MNIRLALACLAAAFAFACQQKDGPTGPATSSAGRGRVFGSDGKPAVGATVRIIPVDYLPRAGLAKRAEAVYSLNTDAAGEFDVSGLPSGQYNILTEKAGDAALSDSVIMSGPSSLLPDDTLSAPGSVRGRIQLQPNHEPASVTVQLLGTTVFANVDAEGRFEIGGLPRGVYSARFASTLTDYVPLFSGFRVESGTVTEITEPFALAYTGIPIVTGIQVSLDTLRGLARVSWHPVKKSDLLGYQVLRDPLNTQSIQALPINKDRITDTFYVDTLYAGVGAGGEARNWEYRVTAQIKSGKDGEWFESAPLRAVPPSTVRTRLSVTTQGRYPNQASVGDTLLFTATYANTGRGQSSLSWVAGNDTLRRIDLGGRRSGEDTLRFVSSATPSVTRVKVVALDDAGSVWTDSLNFTVSADPPQAMAGPDTSLYPGETLHLHGQGIDKFGFIARYEWDIGGTGTFRNVTAGDTAFPAEAMAHFNYPCILRVTDDDGQRGLDTLWVMVPYLLRKTSRPVTAPSWKAFGVSQPHMAELDGKIYVLGGGGGSGEGAFTAYDTTNGTWDIKAPADANGPLYVVGGRILLPLRNGLRSYDPATNTWTAKAPPPAATAQSDHVTAVVLGSSLFVVAGADNLAGVAGMTQSYDPATDAWTIHPSAPLLTETPHPRVEPIWNGLPSDLVQFQGQILGFYPNGGEATFDPNTDKWTGTQGTGRWFRPVPAVEANTYSNATYIWEHGGLYSVSPKTAINFGSNFLWEIGVNDDDDSLGFDIGLHSIKGRIFSLTMSEQPGKIEYAEKPGSSYQPNQRPYLLPVNGTRMASIAAGDRIYVMTWYDSPPVGASDQPYWYELTPF